MYTNTNKLNIVPGGVPLIIHISQGDVGLREFTFEPYTSAGSFARVAGADVTLEATKPDGHAVIHDCTYNNDGSITYELQEQLAAVPGEVWSKIVIHDGDDILGSGTVVWMVDAAGVRDDAVVSDSDLSGIRRLLGTPLAVTTAASMTDQNKLYLYEGSETGYTAGDLYYWNGTAWASGGEYGAGSTAVYTDDGEGNITIS